MFDKVSKLFSKLREEERPVLEFPYEITSEVNKSDSPYRAKNRSPQLMNLLAELGKEAQFYPGKQTVERVQKAIALFPNQPQFYNYLSIAYKILGQNAKELETHHKTHQKFPDYLFGRVAMAQVATKNHEYEFVPEYLGESLRLEDLYPDRKIFHDSEVIAYYAIAGRYHCEMQQIERAEEALDIVEAMDEDSGEAKMLSRSLLFKKVLSVQQKISDMKRNEQTLELRSFSYENQTDTPPAFHHAEMDWLYEHDTVLPPDKVRAILELPRQTLIEDLETVLQDGIHRFAYWNEQPWDGRTHSFLYHAIILLGELRATESLPAVLDQLRQGMEYNDFWFADWSDNVFQTPLYHLGRENLGVIQDFVKEPLIEAFYKNQAAKVVELTALLEPERRGELIEWYRDVIQYFLDNAEDEDLIDTTFLAFLIMDIAKVGFKELKPLAKKVFDHELVTYGIMGNWKDAKKEFDESSADDDPNSYYGDAFKQYEALRETKDAIKTRERERNEQIAKENRKEAARKASPNSWTPDEPIRVEKIGRNERVTVKYLDGTVKQDVKYKSVEDEVAAGKAVLVV